MDDLVHRFDDVAMILTWHDAHFQIESAKTWQLARSKRMPPFDGDDVDMAGRLTPIPRFGEISFSPRLEGGDQSEHLLNGVVPRLDLHRHASSAVGRTRIASGSQLQE